MALGYGAGRAVDRVVTRAGQVGAILAVALATVIVGYVVLTWLRRRRFLWSLRIARGSPEALKARFDAGEKPLIAPVRNAQPRVRSQHVPGSV